MNTSTEVSNLALRLPETERAKLAHQLLLSLTPETFADDWQSAWHVEIEARLNKVGSGQFVAHEWREALAEIKAELTKDATSASPMSTARS